jgi:type I restriction enzyme M protein
MRGTLTSGTTGDQIEALQRDTFYGREKDNIIYPVALANLVLHGIDQPNLWHGNTLTGAEVYGGLFEGAPAEFNVILTNPPFGGKEGKDAQSDFAFKTSATQLLFLQHVIGKLADGGRCGIVLDEGVLFRANESAFVKTKRKLLDDCDLWCIVSLPGGVFSAAGAGVKTNLLFFTKGKSTKRIWYYDLSDIKVGKKTPFTLDKFQEFFSLLSTRPDSDRSWTVDLAARRAAARHQSGPLREEAERKNAEALALRDQSKEQKRSDTIDLDEIAVLEEEASALSKAANELMSRAQSIAAAVYDLKAVNPKAKATEDARTPEELIDFIEAKGLEVSEALESLRASLKGNAGAMERKLV